MAVVDRRSLADFIACCPIIDCHAHPLLPLGSQDPDDLVTIVSEASGSAKAAVPSSLPFIRAVRHLTEGQRSLQGEEYTASERFELYLARRARFVEASFTRESLSGIETLLLDDGLRHKTRPYPYKWHSQFVRSPAKRIIRIETLAEDLLHDRGGDVNGFTAALEKVIDAALSDPEVAGFKSAICYRSGLDIATTADRRSAETVLSDITATRRTSNDPVRFNNKILNDFLVNVLATRIGRYAAKSGRKAKPIQFHTGLGDNDLRLTLANPAHLQDFIEAYPDVPILLLHASYPFTKEAGYLASVYANVYLDVGEIFPMVSRAGQEIALREAFALTPLEKLCWSTDGHFYQETYSLATAQIREVLLSVLSEMVDKKDCTFDQAASMARQLLFDTTNTLYDLGLLFTPLANSRSLPERNARPAAQIGAFLATHPDVRFIRHSWVDFCGTVRTRVLTRPHLERVLNNQSNDGRAFATTSHAPFLLQNDAPGIPDFVATGEMGFFPDYSSLYAHPRKGHASVMGDFRLQQEEYHQHCTRTLLQLALHKLNAEGIHDILLGFELEFYLFEQDALQEGRLVPISSAHAWSTARALQAGGGKALDIIEAIMTALEESGVDAQQFHAEGGVGQYEIPLGPLPVLQAVDQLIHAKEVITYIASIHGYRATFHPKPVPSGAGTGMHMHMSFKPVSAQESFYAGVLDELPAICAFSLGGYHSYDRVSDGTWSGGTFCAWGDQNREAALRRVDASQAHWEMKTMDGMANPYLAVAAVLTAARIGVTRAMTLPSQCDVSAGKLSPEDRQALGIKKPLPRTLKEALSNFFSAYGKRTSLVGTLIDPRSRVTEFIQEFGAEPAIRYAQVKEQEAALIKAQESTKKDSMSVDQASIKARIFFIERY